MYPWFPRRVRGRRPRDTGLDIVRVSWSGGLDGSSEWELLKTRRRNRRKRESESRSGMKIVSTLAAEGRLTAEFIIAWRDCIMDGQRWVGGRRSGIFDGKIARGYKCHWGQSSGHGAAYLAAPELFSVVQIFGHMSETRSIAMSTSGSKSTTLLGGATRESAAFVSKSIANVQHPT